MNRLQAGDLRTYLALSEPTIIERAEYVPRDDESEARRLAVFRGGLGETIYGGDTDTDAETAFTDGFGLEIKYDRAADRRFQPDGEGGG